MNQGTNKKPRTSRAATKACPIAQVVSGGQTGVDRAALDAAMQAGLPVGGWCPRDRRSEDGSVPERYPLKETAARSYAVRTEWNVRDSDGTLVVVLDEISSGTRMTVEAARTHGKPLKVEHLAPDARSGLLSGENSEDEQVMSVVDWIRRHKIAVLNVAGPRGSSSPEMYPRARKFLTKVFLALKPEAVSGGDQDEPPAGRRKSR